MSKLKIEYININKLIPYINNPRINDNAVDKVAASIKEFGFKNPIIVDKENVIIAGHTRMLASRKLGLDEVPIVKIDDLTDKQIKAFRIADNKTSEFAEWDMELLELELEGLDDIFTGFDDAEFDDIMGIDKEVEEDDFDEEPPENPISKRGDIWLLGRSRLMCGDSTTDDVNILMNGKKADMVFTDPPYNVEYTGGIQFKDGKAVEDSREMIKNDDIDLYEPVIKKLCEVANGPCYIWFADAKATKLYEAAEKYGDIHSLIIWVKNGGYGALNANYKKKHEPCLYWKPRGKKLNFTGATTETTIWNIDKDGINKLHPTQKPVALASKAIGNHSAGLVLDLFGGSGSTLIASEQLNRMCYMMELDEKYVDVIVNRYISFKESDEDVFLIRDGTQIHYKEVEKNE